MKNTMICPKCKGKKVIRIDGKVGAYGTGNNIQLGMTIFSAVKVNRYLCCDCGYSEEWVDHEDVQKVLKHYE